jgi:hypothetical protein
MRLHHAENLSHLLSRASKVLTAHGASGCAVNNDVVGGVNPTYAVLRDGQNHWLVGATVPKRCSVACHAVSAGFTSM